MERISVKDQPIYGCIALPDHPEVAQISILPLRATCSPSLVSDPIKLAACADRNKGAIPVAHKLRCGNAVYPGGRTEAFGFFQDVTRARGWPTDLQFRALPDDT